MKHWTFDDVAAHWDSCMEKDTYDTFNAHLDSYTRRFRDTEKYVSINEGDRVLDIDCRTGVGTRWFRKPNATFSCVAMSPKMQQTAEASLKMPVSLLGDLPLSFPEEMFDTILCYETLEHCPDPQLFIKELSRVLKKNGTLVLTTPNPFWEPMHKFSELLGDHGEGPHRFVPIREIREALRDAGLTITKEFYTVLIPWGPKWLLGIGRWFERILPSWLLRMIALRRNFICTNTSDV